MNAARASRVFAATALLAVGAALASPQSAAPGVSAPGPRFLRVFADSVREPVVLDPTDVSPLNRRIRVDITETSRGAALQEIGLAANVQFVFASDVLPSAGSVRVRADSITVAAALREVLAGSGVDVAVARNETLILVRRPAAAALSFHGTLRTAAGGAPVAAAIVTLVDTMRAIQAKARSDDQGRFVLRASGSGLLRLHVQRIGVRPFESVPFRLRGDTTAVIALDELPSVALPPVSSTAVSACHDRSVAAESTWELWEDVRTALLAASITYAEQRSRFSLAQVKRIYDTPQMTLRDIAVLEQTLTAQQPWTSLGPDILAQRGYVRFADERLTFVSPDLDVLLSRSFENTHCFRPALLRDGPLLGLSFEPARTLKNHTDIAGTFWVDRASHELRRLTFRYTGLPFASDDSTGVSTVNFARLDTQDWFIASWTIRAPIPALVSSRAMNVEDQLRLFGRQVEGVDPRPFLWRSGGLNEQRGNVLAVYRDAGTADTSAFWTAPTGTIRVHVAAGTSDQGRQAPISGAEVMLIGSRRQRMSDELGTVEFDQLAAGEYQVAVNTPTLARLLEPAAVIVVRVVANTEARAEVSVRTPGEIIRQRCGTERHVIVGTVSRDGAPVADARVAVYDLSNGPAALPERVDGTFKPTNAEGRFVICASAVDATATLEIRVRGPRGEETSGVVQLSPETNIAAIEAVLPSTSGTRLP